MLIPVSRDEEDIEDLYTDDFFWMHERGVDLIFLLVVFHLLRKMFIMSYTVEQEIAWKSGTLLFLWLHVVIFFGLVLCCTHLSDITLTIASNIISTLTFKTGQFYWILFTDQTLNTDTIIRCMYMHYITGFLTILFGFIHAISMHYDYKEKASITCVYFDISWFNVIFRNEIFKFYDFILFFYFINIIVYSQSESLSYEIFMWGDIGFMNDVRFYGVAPHWYFRVYMSWLLICPHHYVGVFGLIYLMLLLYFQPNIKSELVDFARLKNKTDSASSFFLMHLATFVIFLMCVLYTDSFLPYGRFYNTTDGNIGLLVSFGYIFFYMSSYINKIFFNVFRN